MIGPHIQFVIENITLKQINNLFNLLNGKVAEEPRSEVTQKKLEDIDAKTTNLLGKRSF